MGQAWSNVWLNKSDSISTHQHLSRTNNRFPTKKVEWSVNGLPSSQDLPGLSLLEPASGIQPVVQKAPNSSTGTVLVIRRILHATRACSLFSLCQLCCLCEPQGVHWEWSMTLQLHLSHRICSKDWEETETDQKNKNKKSQGHFW